MYTCNPISLPVLKDSFRHRVSAVQKHMVFGSVHAVVLCQEAMLENGLKTCIELSFFELCDFVY